MSKRNRVNARPLPRPRGRRTSAIAFIGASAVALAAASAWMTMSASPAMTSPTPVAQQQPQPQAQPAPAAAPTVETAAPSAPLAQAAPAPAAPAANAPAQPAPAPAGGAAQQARIDPKTGQFRPIEHDDAQATQAARRLSRTAASEPVEFFTDSGVPGATVPDDLQAYTVATKTPDGKIVIEHVQGGKAAAERVRKNSAKTGLSHRKEEPNDR